jgi:hypothetical protein
MSLATMVARMLEEALANLRLPARQIDGQMGGAQLPPPGAGVPYAGSAHTHPLSELEQSGATTGQVPVWSGSAWAPGTVSGGGGMSNPMTTAGDLIQGGSSGTPQRLAVGSNGQVLTVVSGAPAWAAAAGGGVALSQLGTTSVGGLTENMVTRTLWLKQITPSTNGLLLGVSGAIAGNGGNVFGYYAAVYSNVSGAPGVILSYVPFSRDFDAFFSTTRRWLTIPLIVPVVAGTSYWIGIGRKDNNGTGNPTIAYAAGGSDRTALPTGDWIADTATITTTTRNYSIYATVLS